MGLARIPTNRPNPLRRSEFGGATWSVRRGGRASRNTSASGSWFACVEIPTRHVNVYGATDGSNAAARDTIHWWLIRKPF